LILPFSIPAFLTSDDAADHASIEGLPYHGAAA